MSFRFHRVAAAVSLALLLAAPAFATTMVPQTLADLASKSQGVVRATTLSTTVAWDAHRRVVTTAHLRVSESLAGPLAAGTEIDVLSYGGTIDGVTMSLEGAPEFNVGDDVVMFLDSSRKAPYFVTDLGQGKFEVRRDAAGREYLTRDALGGVHFMFGDVPATTMPLSQLRQNVRSARLAH